MPGGPGKINEYNKSLTPEQRKRNAKRAASKPRKKAYERNANIREIAKLINEAPAGKSIKSSLAALNVDDENMTNAAGIAMAVYRAALKGNIQAVEKWERYVGQSDIEQREEGILADLIDELIDNE